MFRLSIAKTVAIVAAAFSLQASASAINLISNGSFETVDPNAVSNNYTSSTSRTYDAIANDNAGSRWGLFNTSYVTGWTALYGKQIEIDVNGLTDNVDTAFGKNYIELDTHFGVKTIGKDANGKDIRVTTNESNAGIAQSLSGLTVGATYELSFWYRARTTMLDDNLLKVYWMPTAVASALNGALDASQIMPLISQYVVKTVDYKAADNNNAKWVKYTQAFIASNSNMTLGFGADGNAQWESANWADVVETNGNKVGAQLDNVSLVAVPAPASIGLFGLGLLALGLRRRMSK